MFTYVRIKNYNMFEEKKKTYLLIKYKKYFYHVLLILSKIAMLYELNIHRYKYSSHGCVRACLRACVQACVYLI